MKANYIFKSSDSIFILKEFTIMCLKFSLPNSNNFHLFWSLIWHHLCNISIFIIGLPQKIAFTLTFFLNVPKNYYYIDTYLKRPTITCIKRCFYCLFLFLSSAQWSKHWYKSECTNVHFDHFLFTDIIFFGFLCPRKNYFILLSDLLLG